jgi:hypothetical protein
VIYLLLADPIFLGLFIFLVLLLFFLFVFVFCSGYIRVFRKINTVAFDLFCHSQGDTGHSFEK